MLNQKSFSKISFDNYWYFLPFKYIGRIKNSTPFLFFTQYGLPLTIDKNDEIYDNRS